jgi:soluble lytic murein transglycosylase
MAIIFVSVIGIRTGLRISRESKYPVQYSGYITRYARINDLDPYLVIAVIKQESNFVADARSPYAGGLMQLTEETANEYAGKLGMSAYNYMDPETNIQIGCYVLRTLINKYGVTDTALAAYNAGMGNVDSWLSDPSCSHDGMTLSYIPFEETRNYITKINSYMEGYKEHTQL